jgi:hypothetical protein
MDNKLRQKLKEIEEELTRLTHNGVPTWMDSGRLDVGIQAMMIGLAVKDYDKRHSEGITDESPEFGPGGPRENSGA